MYLSQEPLSTQPGRYINSHCLHTKLGNFRVHLAHSGCRRTEHRQHITVAKAGDFDILSDLRKTHVHT